MATKLENLAVINAELSLFDDDDKEMYIRGFKAAIREMQAILQNIYDNSDDESKVTTDGDVLDKIHDLFFKEG